MPPNEKPIKDDHRPPEFDHSLTIPGIPLQDLSEVKGTCFPAVCMKYIDCVRLIWRFNFTNDLFWRFSHVLK